MIDKENAFFDQLALASSIAGQLAFTIFLGDTFKDTFAVCMGVAIMQMVLVVALPNRFARTIATVFAVTAWSLAIRFAWWEHEPWNGNVQAAFGPALIAWVLIWAPVAAVATILVVRESIWMAGRSRQIIRPLLIGLLLSLSFGTAASQPVAAFQIFMRESARTENWLVLWPLLSVSAAAYSMVLALRVRHTALVAAAVVAMLMHVSHFYYLFGTTLVVKSIIMLVLGALLVLIARTMRSSARENS